MPVSALDKSIPLKLSHQSQGNIEKRKKNYCFGKSLNAYPFQVAIGLATSSPDCRQNQNRRPETTETTTTDFRFGQSQVKPHTGDREDRQDRQTAQLPRIQDQACNSIATRCWQINVAAGAVCVCVCESRQVGASRSSVQLRHLLDNLVG